jgi:hypothetical protein
MALLAKKAVLMTASNAQEKLRLIFCRTLRLHLVENVDHLLPVTGSFVFTMLQQLYHALLTLRDRTVSIPVDHVLCGR